MEEAKGVSTSSNTTIRTGFKAWNIPTNDLHLMMLWTEVHGNISVSLCEDITSKHREEVHNVETLYSHWVITWTCITYKIHVKIDDI